MTVVAGDAFAAALERVNLPVASWWDALLTLSAEECMVAVVRAAEPHAGLRPALRLHHVWRGLYFPGVLPCLVARIAAVLYEPRGGFAALYAVFHHFSMERIS